MTELALRTTDHRPGTAEFPQRRADPFSWVTVVLAQITVVAAGFDVKVLGTVSVGLVVIACLSPLMIPSVRRYSLASPIMVLTGLCIVSGLILSEISSTSHTVNPTLVKGSIGVLLSGVAAIAALLWARELVPLHRVVMLYGFGALAEGLLFGQMSWKFDLAIPTTLLVLGFAERFTSKVVPAVAVMGLGIYGALNEARSIFAFCLIASTLTLWQARPTASSGRANRWYPALLMAALAVGIYFIVSALLTAGAFGETLRERSTMQIETTGSLIAGGRPEFAATRELMKLNPAGYGLGVVPSWTDLEAGRSGLTSINVDTGGYVNNYMFGGEFNLHSVAADLWVSYGWVGLALAGTALVGIVRSMSVLISERRAATSVLFACGLGLWYLLFGPIYSNWLEVCLALGLSLLPRASKPGRPLVGSTG